MKQQQGIILVCGKMLQELVCGCSFGLCSCLTQLQTAQTMCSSKTKTVPVLKAPLA